MYLLGYVSKKGTLPREYKHGFLVVENQQGTAQRRILSAAIEPRFRIRHPQEVVGCNAAFCQGGRESPLFFFVES